MADLLSHGLVGWIAGARSLDRVGLGWLVAGTVLPDLASRVPRVALETMGVHGLISGGAFWRRVSLGLELPHTPVGVVLVAVFVAAVLPSNWSMPSARRRIAMLLAGGGALHLLLDLLQEHITPGYHLLYPISATTWELGWLSTEASLAALPGLALVAWLMTPKGGRSEERPPLQG